MLSIIGLLIGAVVSTFLLFVAHYIFFLIITKDLTDEELEKYYENVNRGENYPMD